MFRLVFLVAVLIISCKSQKNNSIIEDELVLVLEDAYFPVDKSFSSVINDQKSLNLLFSKINNTRKPGLSIPEIDFNEKTLIFFAAGEQNGIEEVRLNKKNETEDTVELSIERIENQSSNEIVSFPFCIYELPKINKRIILN